MQNETQKKNNREKETKMIIRPNCLIKVAPHEGDNGIKSTAKFYTEIIFTVKIDSLA
jgi:hypothetical protein